MRRKYWLISGIFALLIILLVVIIFETSESSVKSSVTLDCEPLPTVIIDPGHGGMDGGAVGCDGTLEKNINLSVSLKFADFLKFAGFNVVLTRTEDISLHNEGATRVKDMKTSDLHNRMKIMESTPNNLFISIHQNQYSEEKYHGAQIFYSPNDGESPLLAQAIQSSIASKLQTDNKREIKPSTKSIYLLYQAKSTAVMVECGFLSNAAEVENLKNNEYQNQLAFCVLCGVLDYLKIS